MNNDFGDMQVLDNILEAIGSTPLVAINRVAKDLPCRLLAKVEYMNPGGSVKDRIGIKMIREAEKTGKLKRGGTVVECTSGNTGMGLAIASAVLGYRAVFTMPDKMSLEKINLLKAMGAEVVVTPTAVEPDSPESYYKVAERIVKETPGAYHANQYHNQENPRTHYESTGPEIWKQTAGRITHFVAGMGTGGTISGVGKYLKEQNPAIKIIGIDPEGSILKNYFETKSMEGAHPYKVEGIGEDMIPAATHFEFIDEIVTVTDKESFLCARRVAREEGILVGGSCGTAVAGALKALASAGPDDVAVVLLPDTGERYLSKIYNDEWMRDNGFLEPEAVTVGEVIGAKPSEVPALVTIEGDRPVREAIALVREHDISVIPVMEGGKVVGTAHEGELMHLVFDNPTALEEPTRSVMGPVPPSLSPTDSVKAAIRLLSKDSRAVLVFDKDHPVGILTSIDVVGFISQ